METIITEDGKSVKPGDRVYNYYDMEAGIIRPGSLRENGNDIWFDFLSDAALIAGGDIALKYGGGSTLLNGQRICTIEYAKRRGFRNA